MVIHNAPFDMAFINHELKSLKYEIIPEEQVLDTLALSRKKHPMGPNSLDALCRRYSIDNSNRTKHGALLDAELLASVYLELIGGRQQNLAIAQDSVVEAPTQVRERQAASPRPNPLPSRLTDGELAAHETLVESLGSAPLWDSYRN